MKNEIIDPNLTFFASNPVLLTSKMFQNFAQVPLKVTRARIYINFKMTFQLTWIHKEVLRTRGLLRNW